MQSIEQTLSEDSIKEIIMTLAGASLKDLANTDYTSAEYTLYHFNKKGGLNQKSKDRLDFLPFVSSAGFNL